MDLCGERMTRVDLKEPTYCQKKLIASRALVVNDWLVYRENPSDLMVVHRYTGEIRVLQ